MISRVADHCFWFGRYIERAEATSRMLAASVSLALDAELPPAQVWRPVLSCRARSPASPGSRPTTTIRLGQRRDRQRFMVWDDDSGVSLVRSIQGMRWNARSIREVLSPGVGSGQRAPPLDPRRPRAGQLRPAPRGVLPARPALHPAHPRPAPLHHAPRRAARLRLARRPPRARQPDRAHARRPPPRLHPDVAPPRGGRDRPVALSAPRALGQRSLPQARRRPGQLRGRRSLPRLRARIPAFDRLPSLRLQPALRHPPARGPRPSRRRRLERLRVLDTWVAARLANPSPAPASTTSDPRRRRSPRHLRDIGRELLGASAPAALSLALLHHATADVGPPGCVDHADLLEAVRGRRGCRTVARRRRARAGRSDVDLVSAPPRGTAAHVGAAGVTIRDCRRSRARRRAPARYRR